MKEVILYYAGLAVFQKVVNLKRCVGCLQKRSLDVANWLVWSNIRLKLILLNDTMMLRRIHTTVVGVVDNASDKMGYLALAMYVLVHYITAFIYNREAVQKFVYYCHQQQHHLFFIINIEERINTHTCYGVLVNSLHTYIH